VHADLDRLCEQHAFAMTPQVRLAITSKTHPSIAMPPVASAERP
jgi:hypothetical protein